MIEKNPSDRKSAEIYLSQTRGTLFPEYFYSFLQLYMQIFSAAPILSPDEKISRLRKDIENIIGMLKNKEQPNTMSIEEKPVDTEKSDDLVKSTETTEEVLELIDEQDLNKIEDPPVVELDEFSAEEVKEEEIVKDVKGEDIDNSDGLVIITQLVTSSIRGLHHSESKLQSLEILLELAENTSDETILDRILPYIVVIFLF